MSSRKLVSVDRLKRYNDQLIDRVITPNLANTLQEVSENFGHSLSISGTTLNLLDYDGTVLNSVTLPQEVIDHASNKVTAMTGYSEPSSLSGTGAIETTDSLNAALGKLEYKANNALVNIGEVNTKVDNIKVGGRNLLLDSEKERSVSTSESVYLTIPLSDYAKSKLSKYKVFCVKFLAKFTNVQNLTNFESYLRAQSIYVGNSAHFDYSGAVADKYQEYTGIIDNSNISNNTSAINLAIRFVHNAGSTVSMYVKEVKLEFGNKATTYTPAPEDIDSSISTAQSTANTAISNNAATQTQLDNLQVGGVNRFKQLDTSLASQVTYSDGAAVIDLSASGDIYFGLELYDTIPEGTQITVSFDVSGMNEDDVLEIGFITSTTAPITLSNGRCSQTFPFIVQQDRNKVILLKDNTHSGTGIVTLSNFKVEYGNMATTYSPAPEDIDALITTAQSTVQAGVDSLNSESLPTGEILWLSAKGCTTASIAQENGVIDVSGNGNHGTGGCEVVIDEQYGACFKYTDNDTKQTKINKQSFIAQLNSLTKLSIRVKSKTTTANRQHIAGLFKNNSNWYCGFSQNTSGTILTFRDRDKTLTASINTYDAHDYIAVVDFDNSKAYLYIDGILKAQSDEWYDTPSGEITDVMIGGMSQISSYYTYHFNGYIYDFRIYSYALSGSQVKALYKYGQQPQDNTLVNNAINYATKLYGTCSTAAATAAKAVSLTDFQLFTGAMISVKFSNENTASDPTLNVNSTGAKPIYAFGAAITSSYYWVANQTIVFVYNGTQWEMVGRVSSDDPFLPLTGGTLTGSVNTNSLIPSSNNSYDIGTSSAGYNHIYANNVHQSGNAVLDSSSIANLNGQQISAIVEGVTKNTKCYGIRIDQSNSDPDACVTYLYDAVGMTPAALTADDTFDYGDWQDFVYDICKPVMVAPDGTELYGLDRDDQTKKADGTASGISDTTQTANAMVRFKRMYLTVTEPDTDTIDVVFSEFPLDANSNAYPFTDGSCDIKDCFYYSMFEGVSINSVVRSIANNATPLNSLSGETMRTRCQANGDGWDFPSFSQRNYINLLHVLISKSLNSQGKFGEGNSNGGQNAPSLVGALKAVGGFSGKKTVDTAPVKTFWIENYWGNLWKWHNGLLGYNSDYYVKNTPPYTNNSTSGYTKATTAVGDDYIRKMKAFKGLLLPSSVSGGSASIYWCDKSWKATTAVVRSAHFGGSRAGGGNCGSFAVAVNDRLSNSSWDVGCRLAFL